MKLVCLRAWECNAHETIDEYHMKFSVKSASCSRCSPIFRRNLSLACLREYRQHCGLPEREQCAGWPHRPNRLLPDLPCRILRAVPRRVSDCSESWQQHQYHRGRVAMTSRKPHSVPRPEAISSRTTQLFRGHRCKFETNYLVKGGGKR